jgi:hypothetical protein
VEDSVHPEPRMDDANASPSGCEPDVPEWAHDDLATRLVLYLQYPPAQFREKYRLVIKHWRRKEPMRERRTDMLRIREKGDLVFARNKEGKWYFIDNESSDPASAAVRRSYLTTLKRSGYPLNYRSWKFLNQKRPQRNKMNLTPSEMEPIIQDLEGTFQKARLSPGDFPFISNLANPSIWSVVRQSVLSNWKSLFSGGYIHYAVDLSLSESKGSFHLFAGVTVVYFSVYLLLSYIEKHWFPNNPAWLLIPTYRQQRLLLSLLLHRKLPPFRSEAFHVILESAGAIVIWSYSAWAIVLFYPLFSKKPLENDPALRQKLQSWFRTFLSRP